jgi:hypothetical protein
MNTLKEWFPKPFLLLSQNFITNFSELQLNKQVLIIFHITWHKFIKNLNENMLLDLLWLTNHNFYQEIIIILLPVK